MSHTLKNTWETYTSSWKATSADAKRSIFEKCLDKDCTYTDPISHTEDWDALLNYMLEFHQQIPGGHFVTTYFLAHHKQSIAKWDMKNGNDIFLGEGISYGKFSNEGKLLSMSGFFETPT